MSDFTPEALEALEANEKAIAIEGLIKHMQRFMDIDVEKVTKTLNLLSISDIRKMSI